MCAVRTSYQKRVTGSDRVRVSRLGLDPPHMFRRPKFASWLWPESSIEHIIDGLLFLTVGQSYR